LSRCVSGAAQPVVAAYVNSMVPDAHAADDLLQETAVVLFRKIDELVNVGGTQILMQGGLHPELRLDYYCAMLRAIKYWRSIIRSGLVGTFVGAVPGVGEDIAAWTSYDLAKSASKEPEKFVDK